MSNQITRRETLQKLGQLVAALPLLAVFKSQADKPRRNTFEENEARHERCLALGRAISPSRSALIEVWENKLDATVGPIWEMWDFLYHARYTRPQAVDAAKLLNLIERVKDACGELESDLGGGPASDLCEAVTGRYEGAAFLEQIMADPDCPWQEAPSRCLLEIDAISQTYPQEGPRLRAIWQAKFGAAPS
jgi:hypothetical protein